MRFALCNEMFQDRSWESMCDFVASLGYEGLEVAPFTLADRADLVSAHRRSELRAAAESRGLEILGLHWLLVKPPGLYITDPIKEVRRKTGEYFIDLVDLCADLGGKVMVIGSPKQRNLHPHVSLEQAMTYAQEVFETALPAAEQRDVTLAFEPLGPLETNFINTASEAIELIRRINHPNFRLNLDVKAMSSESTSIPQIIATSAPYIAHVQVNDPNLLGPGMGTVKYEPIIAALRQAGYDSWLSVEAFDMTPTPEKIAKDSIAYLRKVTSGFGFGT